MHCSRKIILWTNLAPYKHCSEDDLKSIEEVVADDDDGGAAGGPALARADRLDRGCSCAQKAWLKYQEEQNVRNQRNMHAHSYWLTAGKKGVLVFVRLYVYGLTHIESFKRVACVGMWFHKYPCRKQYISESHAFQLQYKEEIDTKEDTAEENRS